MTRLVILGAGGHARVLVEALRAGGAAVDGYATDNAQAAVGVMMGLPRIGDDEAVRTRGSDGIALVNGVGSVGKSNDRRAIFERFRAARFTFHAVIHPSAVVASDVLVGEGAQIMAGAVLQPGVRIGANALVNTGALVDHDCVIGDHAHVAPGACLAGNVVVGEGAHVGAGAVVKQNIKIGANAIVGAGAVVVDDVPANVTVTGVPAKAR